MKKSLIIVLAVILALAATAAVFAKSKKAKIWSGKKLTKVVKSIRKSVVTLQTKVAALEASDLEAKTYEGTIDLTAAGDTTTSCNILAGGVTCHWKKISMSELDLSKLPNIQLYVKPATAGASTVITSDLPSADAYFANNSSIVILAAENGQAWVAYKYVDGSGDHSIISGSYKIVLT
ncbi:MAG: hypothetical protein AB1465_07225, partial [Patescibacteria group bacterium]